MAPTEPPNDNDYRCDYFPPSEYTTLFTQDDFPHERDATDGKQLVLGQQFTTSVAGDITAIRYFHSGSDDGSADRKGYIYSWPEGRVLASTAGLRRIPCREGWVSLPLTKPLLTIPGKVYMIVIDGLIRYVKTENYFQDNKTNGAITAVANGARYGFECGTMPKDLTDWSGKTNYFIDSTLTLTS